MMNKIDELIEWINADYKVKDAEDESKKFMVIRKLEHIKNCISVVEGE